jgi:peroxiredoxin
VAAVAGLVLVVWWFGFRTPAGTKATAGKKGRKPAATAGRTAAPAAGDQEKLSLADLIERLDDGVVLVNGLDPFGKEVALGSGFIIDRSGLVATNYHVVSSSAKAYVRFRDGKKVDVAGYRAYDPSRDLAILELSEPPKNLEVLKLAGPESPRQGSEVIAIGHPRGFKFTTTTGIVSGVYTTEELPDNVQYFLDAPDDNVWIQTTAVISHGSSGGPLLNSRGEVIGINTWITEGLSLGFATHVRNLVELREHRLLGLTVALSVAGEAGATDETPLGKIDERVARVVNDYRRAYEEFAVLLKQQDDEKEKEALFKTKNPVAAHAPKLLALADQHRKTQAAFQALYIVCQMIKHAPPDAVAPFITQATDRIVEDHLDQEPLLGLAARFAEFPHDAGRAFLRQLLEKSPHRDVQGVACYSLAQALEKKTGNQPAEEAEIVTLLERVMRDFDNVFLNGERLGSLAKPRLFEKKYLGIGKPAPEIEGSDAEGATFKLSDFRGKVVLLDFWADWCPYCTEMYPQERLLLEKYKDRPFAIVGVNGDDKERLQTVQGLKKVTWRSWWDGPRGPISELWNVQSLPSLFVLDHTGTIRFKDLKGAELETAIEQLVKETPAQPSSE